MCVSAQGGSADRADGGQSARSPADRGGQARTCREGGAGEGAPVRAAPARRRGAGRGTQTHSAARDAEQCKRDAAPGPCAGRHLDGHAIRGRDAGRCGACRGTGQQGRRRHFADGTYRCHCNVYSQQFSTTFPRKVFTAAEREQTLRTLGLVPNAALEAAAK